jgi:hypothetical protein
MAGMKPRQAAALALVGWYLMVPPVGSFKAIVTSSGDVTIQWTIRDHASSPPLTTWSISKSFDTAAECEAQRMNHIQSVAICVATDDPRLKEK